MNVQTKQASFEMIQSIHLKKNKHKNVSGLKCTLLDSYFSMFCDQKVLATQGHEQLTDRLCLRNSIHGTASNIKLELTLHDENIP